MHWNTSTLRPERLVERLAMAKMLVAVGRRSSAFQRAGCTRAFDESAMTANMDLRAALR
jgi:hypothetical protein